MAKTKAPLLSFGGSGSVAKTVVYSTWKGVKYARQHVIPANPQTTAQMVVRRTFALLREIWKVAPELLTAPWNSFAQGRPFTGMNKLVGENVRVLNGEADMLNFIGSPGSKGGLPPDSVVAATGTVAGEVTATFLVPVPPTGWTLTRCVAIAFPDQAPDGIFTGPIASGSDATNPYVVTLGGFVPGADVIVCGWLEWVKPNGDTAYSVGVTGTAIAFT